LQTKRAYTAARPLERKALLTGLEGRAAVHTAAHAGRPHADLAASHISRAATNTGELHLLLNVATA
jgi:hypothetical protein